VRVVAGEKVFWEGGGSTPPGKSPGRVKFWGGEATSTFQQRINIGGEQRRGGTGRDSSFSCGVIKKGTGTRRELKFLQPYGRARENFDRKVHFDTGRQGSFVKQGDWCKVES